MTEARCRMGTESCESAVRHKRPRPLHVYTITHSMAEVGKVSVLYEAKALIGEAPFYDQAREELVWVDIEGKSINFLDVNTRSNRSLPLEDRVGAAIPCQDDDRKLVAVLGRKICLVDRESGEWRYSARRVHHCIYVDRRLQLLVNGA